MYRGYLKLWRKSIESDVFQNPELWRVWTWCLMKSSHKKRSFPFKTGKGKLSISVNSGSFLFGRNSAADALGDSPSTVWKRMKKLESIGCISITSNKQYSTVSICNWEDYQADDIEEVTSRELPSDKQGTSKEQASDTNKNDKNVKNVKNKDISPVFTKTAEELKNVSLLRKPNKKITDTVIKNWSNTIRLMVEKDGLNIEAINKSLNWYRDNWDGEYIPVIESAKSLREKWDKLTNAINRGTPQEKDSHNGFNQRDYQTGSTNFDDLPDFLKGDNKGV